MDDSITGDDTAGAKLLDFAGKAATTVMGAADDVLGPALDEASDAVFGDMTEKPFSEAAPQLTAELQENAKFLKNAASDPKVRAALREYGEALGEAVDAASEVVKPVINEAITDTLQAMDEAGEKAAIGTVNTGLNLFKAAVAEIPVVGAVVDLGLAGAQAINYTAQAASPMIVSGAKTMSKAMDAVDEALPEIGAIQDKIENAASELTGALSSIEGEASNVLDSAKEAAEGVAKSAENTVQGQVDSAAKMAKGEAGKMLDSAKTAAEGVAKSAENAIQGNVGSVTKLAEDYKRSPNLTMAKMAYKNKDTIGKAASMVSAAKAAAAAGGGRRKARRTARRISRSLERFTRRRK